MKSFNKFIKEDETKTKVKKVSVGKSVVKINPNKDDLKERADTWHPDPEQDRKLGGPGANQRAREDRAAASKPKEDPKKLKPGESYMDYAKRHGYKPRTESHVPGQPAERLGAVTGIPKSEQEAAKQRLIAKYKKLRDAKSKPGKVYDPMKDSSFDHDKAEKTRGQSGTYSKEEVEYTVEDAKMGKQSDEKLSAMHKQFSATDQSSPANKFMLNRVQKEINRRKKPSVEKAMGESLSFSDFMEARRMDKEGVDRGDSGRAGRAERAKTTLAAAQKQKKVYQASHDKETAAGRTPRSSRDTLTMPEREHKRDFPGSRQAPKEKGAKESPAETHRRQVNRQVSRVVKHGHTAKEKEANRGMENAGSRFD